MLRQVKLIIVSSILLTACTNNPSDDTDKPSKDGVHTVIKHDIPTAPKNLPIYGEVFYENGDTIHHTIPPFGFTNQNMDTITHKTVNGKIHLADFIFTSCGGQCPMMTAALKRVQQNTQDLDYNILSFTIDPARDTAETFKRYIETSGIDDYNWHFLTGTRDDLKSIGEEGYMAVSGVDQIGEGDGDNHSNAIYLIDEQRRIRGLYNGTDPEEVDQLIKDLKKLATH